MPLISRICAILLVALAVSPFTAPFASCDLATVTQLHQTNDSLSSGKIVKDAPTIAFASATVPLNCGASLMLAPAAAVLIDLRSVRSYVLRL